MTKLIKKLLLSASVAVGVSTVGAVPAIAADFTATGYYTYDYNGWQNTDVILYDTKTEGGQTYTYVNENANINDILDGDSSNPGGNIEMFASSEGNNNNFWNNQVTSLTGEINGQQLTLSSLNAYDWFWDSTINDYNWFYGGNTLATEWFTQLWDRAVAMSDNILVQNMSYSDAFGLFAEMGGFQRSSDPNISYVNIGSDGNDINIGLAGHYDLSDLYSFLPSGIQASEVVKYTYNGVTDYLYSFTATESGLAEWSEYINEDKTSSHSGNYEVTIAVPEPSTMIGLMTVGGLLVAAKKKGQSKKDA